MKSFVVVNRSCYRRQEEIAMVRRFLFINDYSEATDLAQTDLVILFTCAFCKSRVADMLQEIARIRSVIKKDCELMVGSCLPATDKEVLRSVFDGKTLTPEDFSALNLLPGVTVRFEELAEFPSKDAACSPLERPSGTEEILPEVPLVGVATRLEGDKRMGVFIASGCLRKCSYCAIRFATGKLRSKSIDTVQHTVIAGLQQGYRRFEIYADSLGDYGLDIGSNLGVLLEWILTYDANFTIGIYDLHPQAFLKHFDVILALCKAQRVHYLYVPLQSGNSRILGLMNRPCNLIVLQERLRKIRSLDCVFLQTGVMLGFPGETEDEFHDTVAFLEAVQFSDVYVHFYSDMPNTASSHMSGKIDKKVMLERFSTIEATDIRFSIEKTRHEWSSIPVLN